MAGWVAYVDESGSRTGARGKPGWFVLACVAGSPPAIADLAGKIRNLKLGLVPGKDPASWELHAVGMFHDRGGSPLRSIGRDAQMDAMQKIVDIVCDSDIVLFKAVVPAERRQGKRATEAKTVRHATEIIVDQMEKFAERKGDVTFRIVSDHVHEKHRLAMKGAIERRAPESSPKSRARRRVTGIGFVDSRSSEIVQAVDGVAYMINRNVGGDARFGALARDIERKASREGRPCV